MLMDQTKQLNEPVIQHWITGSGSPSFDLMIQPDKLSDHSQNQGNTTLTNDGSALRGGGSLDQDHPIYIIYNFFDPWSVSRESGKGGGEKSRHPSIASLALPDPVMTTTKSAWPALNQ